MVVNRSLVSSSLVFALAFSFGTGCTRESDPASDVAALGDIGNLYLDYIALLNDVDRYFCGCSVAKGNYADMQECVAATGGPAVVPMLANCYAEVLDHMESDRDYVECQTSQYMQYLDCIENAGCGGDIASCQTTMGDSKCPKLSYAANAAIAETCLGYEMPPAFKCGDGTEIVPWNECNFWPDCADGSDEHSGCPEGFKCQSGDLIPKDWTCDGTSDCPDADDESDC